VDRLLDPLVGRRYVVEREDGNDTVTDAALAAPEAVASVATPPAVASVAGQSDGALAAPAPPMAGRAETASFSPTAP
jgi:hypothetical protein